MVVFEDCTPNCRAFFIELATANNESAARFAYDEVAPFGYYVLFGLGVHSFIAEGVRVYEASPSHWVARVRARHIGTGGLRLHICLPQVQRRRTDSYHSGAKAVRKSKLNKSNRKCGFILS